MESQTDVALEETGVTVTFCQNFVRLMLARLEIFTLAFPSLEVVEKQSDRFFLYLQHNPPSKNEYFSQSQVCSAGRNDFNGQSLISPFLLRTFS